MTDRAALLDYADQVLAGVISLGARSARTAALLARCALENWLDERSASWFPPGEVRPTTRSKLVALSTLHNAEVGERAKGIWDALSRACHHHAYELQPSSTEIKMLIAKVRQLEDL